MLNPVPLVSFSLLLCNLSFSFSFIHLCEKKFTFNNTHISSSTVVVTVEKTTFPTKMCSSVGTFFIWTWFPPSYLCSTKMSVFSPLCCGVTTDMSELTVTPKLAGWTHVFYWTVTFCVKPSRVHEKWWLLMTARSTLNWLWFFFLNILCSSERMKWTFWHSL